MRILLFGEFSGLFNCLKEGLVHWGMKYIWSLMVMALKIILLTLDMT